MPGIEGRCRHCLANPRNTTTHVTHTSQHQAWHASGPALWPACFPASCRRRCPGYCLLATDATRHFLPNISVVTTANTSTTATATPHHQHHLSPLSCMQLEIIHELAEGMKGCSTAFVAVALAGIALTVAASSGLPMEDAPEVRQQQQRSASVD